MGVNDSPFVTPSGVHYTLRTKPTHTGKTLYTVVIPGYARTVRPHADGWISEAGQTFPSIEAVADYLATLGGDR